jgi:hypothetical protein
MSKSSRTSRVALNVVFGVFSLPALVFGLYLFACWLRIHTTDVYYVQYPYLRASLAFFAVAACSLLCSVYGAWRRSLYGLLFAIPLLLGLAAMVYIPDGTPHVQRSMVADTNYLSSVNSFFRVWYEANHRFPANAAEFNDALKSGPAAWQNRVKSPSTWSFYSHRGVPLPYELVVVTSATGPRIDDVSDRPGVVYYCVSSDQQEFWVTMTALSEDVARTATLKRVADLPYEKVWLVKAAGKDYPVHKP